MTAPRPLLTLTVSPWWGRVFAAAGARLVYLDDDEATGVCKWQHPMTAEEPEETVSQPVQRSHVVVLTDLSGQRYLSFESNHGPLRYATDAYEARWSGDMPAWQANVRAVALALEALRAVDRYGVTKRGEQYRGWTALPSARVGEFFTTKAEAVAWMLAVGELPPEAANDVSMAALYRNLARRMHPDAPDGNAELWARLDSAATMLGLRKGAGDA